MNPVDKMMSHHSNTGTLQTVAMFVSFALTVGRPRPALHEYNSGRFRWSGLPNTDRQHRGASQRRKERLDHEVEVLSIVGLGSGIFVD